jgi:uncharacterized protein YciI
MKIIYYPLLVCTLILGACTAEQKQEQTAERELIPDQDPEMNPDYDPYNAELAEELGADDYGMRFYIMAFLKAGPNRDQDSAEAAELQRMHLDNIRRMADEGLLVVAGPFMDTGELRGIYLFAVPTIEEARELTMTDPAIKAGRLFMEFKPWYGSAALMKTNALHKLISKEEI